MPQFRVAHIQEQGVDLIITEVDSSFEYQSEEAKDKIVAELQWHAKNSRPAGLAGTVVPAWSAGDRLKFRAPPQWHQFFQSLTPEWLAHRINKTLSLP